MPQPAPARFDASDRRGLRASLLTAVGPTFALAVLVIGYALSAHVCQRNMRALMIVNVLFGAIATAASARSLVRLAHGGSDHAAIRRLRPAAIALQVFCLLVIAAFGIALATVAPCG
jgi:hypothetical protein